MPDKRCPKCGKNFDEDWQLCDECGVDLVTAGTKAGIAGKIEPVSPSKLRNRFKKWDVALDSRISKAVESAEEVEESIETMGKHAAVKATVMSEKAGEKAQDLEKRSLDITRRMRMAGSTDAIINNVINYPRTILLAVLLVTVVIGTTGIPPMLDNISGDMQIYLPQDDETSKILAEVNEDWSTDIMVLFVETPNKFDLTYNTNITDYEVLIEMSDIEDTFDPLKDDFGNEDEVSFVLSISSLIKEINEAPQNVAEATSDEVGTTIGGTIPGEHEYAIPEDQDEIDLIVTQIPEDTKRLLVNDTNNDGIWDSAGIIMGVVSDDQEAFMREAYKIIDDYFIDTRASEDDYNSKEAWWERVNPNGSDPNQVKVHCAMTPTGPVPMTDALTTRTYQEFSVVLPAALALICIVLIILHRTPKIVVVSGVPIFCSLVITLGIMGLTGWTLSPQVILVAPILLALGVAYGLYIANRYSDERGKIKDKKERMKVSINTTGKAIFLSAVTTAVGFSSLMFVNMIPMRVLGFGLTVGIMICYTVTMLTVPALVMALNYEKRSRIRSVEKLGRVPIKHRKKIVVFAVIITIFSLASIPAIQANMNLTEMAPQDEPTIIKMDQYSKEFGGGQLGMVLVRGSPAPKSEDSNQGLEGTRSMKDIEVLEEINRMEEALKSDPGLKINPPISVVDVMKMIKLPGTVINQLPMQYIPDEMQDRIKEMENASFWDAIQTAGSVDAPLWEVYSDGKTVQDSLINIFYNSITIEMRAFLVSISDEHYYSRALVYIDIPAMDAVDTEESVKKVNDIITSHPAGDSTSKLTGFAALLVAVNNLLMFNSIFSLFVALLIVFFVLVIIFRSLRYAALTMIPVSMVVAWEPLTLGATGIDLNLITAMIGSIIVGIGIDYGIHMTERIRENGENFGGIKNAVQTSGFTFFEATATIVAGLLSIFLINVQSIQEFITMVIILLIFSMVGAMLLLPSIYALLSSDKERKETVFREVVEVEPE